MSEPAEFDVGLEARILQISLRQSRVLLLAFCLAFPAALAVLAGSLASLLDASRSESNVSAIGTGVLSVPCLYLVFRAVSSLGPVRVTIATAQLTFRYGGGKVVAWELSSLRSVLLIRVEDLNGIPYDYASAGLRAHRVVPSIQRGLGKRYALSNAAASAIRDRLVREGWHERTTAVVIRPYQCQSLTLTKPRPELKRAG